MSNNNNCYFPLKLFIEFRTYFFDILSNELVGSSKISICGFIAKALAKATLCLCPPEIFKPLSPAIFFSFSLKFLINSLQKVSLTIY